MERILDLSPSAAYVDRKAQNAAASPEIFHEVRRKQFAKSTTVYVGNLGYYTTESQLRALFERCGAIADVVLGLNAQTRTPCGFAFIEFEDQRAAHAAVADLDKIRLDDRTIKVSWDVGDVRETTRFWGRGFSGAQTRDEYRQDVDPGRAGLGVRRATEAGVQRKVIDEELVFYDWVLSPAWAQRPGKKRPRED